MAEETTLLSASESPTLVAELSSSASEPWLRRRARQLVLGRLSGIRTGRLELLENGTRRDFGATETEDVPRGRVLIADGAFWERLAWGGSIGAAEAFCDGFWSSPDLTAVIRVLARNQRALQEMDGGTAAIGSPLRRALHTLRSNTRAGSMRNISAHYDKGNEFFARFLDPTLTYSAAIYPHSESSLEEAQRHKLDTICRKLELRPDDRLIEIGTGWGGLAIHAARHYGCRVVSTTISERQFAFARQAVAAAGLEERIEILRADYRELPERFARPFDKLVSIEMIEAVGHDYLPRYFEVLDRLLAPQGLALVQAIVIPDQRYDTYRRSVDFIQRYIFPGGHLPSLARIQQCTAKHTSLHLVDLDDLTSHYARTLNDWRRRFLANERAVTGMQLSPPERRKWEFYFSYCEGGFLERVLGSVQLTWAKPGYRRSGSERSS